MILINILYYTNNLILNKSFREGIDSLLILIYYFMNWKEFDFNKTQKIHNRQ